MLNEIGGLQRAGWIGVRLVREEDGELEKAGDVVLALTRQ